MTAILSLLDTLTEETQIEELRTQALNSYGIDILGVYCLHTGRQIGTFDPSELQFAIEEEPVESDDELVDALVVRTIASMRPSPALNKPDRLTVRELVAKRPVDGLSFLMNRLYGNRHTIRQRTEAWFEFMITRIRTRQKLELAASEGLKLHEWTHWLLELDSKLNLHDLTPPLFRQTKESKWVVDFREGIPLIDAMLEPGVLAAFESWVFKHLADYENSVRAAELQANFSRGNQMTGPAFVRSYLEFPEVANRKRAEELKRLAARKGKPGRPVSEKTQKINAKVAEFMGMLEGILDGGEAPTIQSAKPKPVFTGGMLFKSKES